MRRRAGAATTTTGIRFVFVPRNCCRSCCCCCRSCCCFDFCFYYIINESPATMSFRVGLSRGSAELRYGVVGKVFRAVYPFNFSEPFPFPSVFSFFLLSYGLLVLSLLSYLTFFPFFSFIIFVFFSLFVLLSL